MKQFKYLAMAAAGMLLATSCANEEMPAPQGDGVTFTLRLPAGMTTRASSAFGDGKDAVNLTYAVYKSSDHTLIMSETRNNFFDGTTLENTLSLDLLNGETYDIVFWAQSSTDAYSFDSGTGTISVDYSKVTSNSEEFDAFWTADKNFTVSGPVSKTVTLTRPFAQINFGTTDLALPAVTKEFGTDWASLQTTLSLSGVPDQLNLLSGETSGSADYTKSCGIPTGQAFPDIKDYTGPALNYLSMNYVLTGSTKDVKDLAFTVENSATGKLFNTIQVAAAPLQANYRTNVFGKLLTTTTEFKVVIDPIFEGEYNPLWDGNTQITLDGNTVNIFNVQLTEGLTVSGNGTLNISSSSIAPTAENTPAITLADGADVKINVNGVRLTGSKGADAIRVPETAALTLSGKNLTAIGNNGKEYINLSGYGNTTDTSYAGKAGSGIGNADAKTGSITINDLTGLRAEGYGLHAFGIGGQTTSVNISNSTIDYARGGFAQPLCLSDNSYGKSEPEGGAAIGTGFSDGHLTMNNVIVTKADGGSKSAAIGAQYWSDCEIRITDCTFTGITGGNASAAVGGGRYQQNNTTKLSIYIADSSISCQGGQFGAGVGSGYDTYCATNSPEACFIEITGQSRIAAVGGKYGAGIGTGFHVGGLSGSIASGVDTTGTAAGTPDWYKASYTVAQNIGYGVCDPARELKDVNITFTVDGKVISAPEYRN